MKKLFLLVCFLSFIKLYSMELGEKVDEEFRYLKPFEDSTIGQRVALKHANFSLFHLIKHGTIRDLESFTDTLGARKLRVNDIDSHPVIFDIARDGNEELFKGIFKDGFEGMDAPAMGILIMTLAEYGRKNLLDFLWRQPSWPMYQSAPLLMPYFAQALIQAQKKGHEEVEDFLREKRVPEGIRNIFRISTDPSSEVSLYEIPEMVGLKNALKEIFPQDNWD